MKKFLLIFFAVIFLVGISFFFLRKNSSNENLEILKEIILFYGRGCPHCEKVEKFIKENNLREKIYFEEREVYFNRKNARLLEEIAKKCNLTKNEIGVPFLWDGKVSKCIVGDEPIINYFKEKLKI